MRRPQTSRVAALLGSVLVLSGIPASSSAQEVSTPLVGYDATATGAALTAFPRLPALLPVEAPIEATVATATATLSSGGQGFGRASTFFPGTLVAGLRPLIETGAGARLPIPDYPVVVEAREFEEAKHLEVPGITMATDVDPARAVSTADAGAVGLPGVLGVRSMHTESRTELVDDGITATSTTAVDGIDLAGMLTIGSVVSTATVHSDGTTATCSARVRVSDVLVGGSHATIDDDGIHVDGQELLPGVDVGAALAQALAASGITVRVLSGETACRGSQGNSTGAGLFINVPTPAIGPVSEGGLTAVLGSTSATAGGSALPADDVAPGAPVDLGPGFGDVIDVPGPDLGGGVPVPAIPPRRGGTVDLAPQHAAYAFDGVPLSLLAGLLLLALAGAGRLRRYLEHIIGLAGP